MPSAIRALAFYTDAIPPSLTLTAPRDGSVLPTARPTLELQYVDADLGVDP
jgi:hypothetical protein